MASLAVVIVVSIVLALAPSSSTASWSHCSAGSDVADKEGVRGLFVAGANQTSPRVATAEKEFLLNDKTICGANLVIPWSAIDRGPGARPRYNWSFLTKAAAPWEAAGKIVNLIVWGTDEVVYNEVNMYGEECPATIRPDSCHSATPHYVLASTKTVNCGPRGGTEIPVYWERGYEKPWRAFQAALIAHVADNSDIGYIRFGLGTGGEDFPSTGFEEGACSEQWTADGLTAARWLKWSISQLEYEASLHSNHPLNVGIASFPGAPTLPDQVAATAARHDMGFGFQGMTVDQIHLDESSPERCYAGWCHLFKTWTGHVPLEIQTLAPTNPYGEGYTGTLPQLSNVVTKAHAQVLELYPQEWLVANDPGWPTYKKYHQEYAHALAQASSEVGGQA